MASCQAQQPFAAPGAAAECHKTVAPPVVETGAKLPAGFPTHIDSPMAWQGSQYAQEDDYTLYLTSDDLAEAERGLEDFKGKRQQQKTRRPIWALPPGILRVPSPAPYRAATVTFLLSPPQLASKLLSDSRGLVSSTQPRKQLSDWTVIVSVSKTSRCQPWAPSFGMYAINSTMGAASASSVASIPKGTRLKI